MTNPMTGPGQIIYGTTGGAPAKLDNGTQYQYMRAGASGPEYADMGSMAETVITTGHTLALADIIKGLVVANKDTGFTMTVAKAASVAYLANSAVGVLNKGAGDLTIALGTGVSLNGETGVTATIAQWEMGYLRRLAEDVWALPNFTAS